MKKKFKSLSDLLGTFNDPAINRQCSTRDRSAYDDTAFNFLALLELWPEIVGKRLAEHSIPLKNTQRTLTILTDHSVFSQQLSFMEEAVKEKIFTKFPRLKKKINRLRFQTNSDFFKKKSEQLQNAKLQSIQLQEKHNKEQKIHPYSPEYQRLKKAANDLFEEIKDPELKKSLSSIFIQQSVQKETRS